MKGVILRINPDAQIVDITHQVAPFDLLDGALAIANSYSYFPPRSIHVVVVDPGVGTERRPLLVSGQNQYFLAPDNGVLSGVYEKEQNVVVRNLTSEHYFAQPVSKTFHGRDVFAPVAAWLSKLWQTSSFGDAVTDFVKFAIPRPKAAENTITAVVLKVDNFGNLITNLRAEDVPAVAAADGKFKIRVGNGEITKAFQTFAQGTAGEPFALIGSSGYVEISLNKGNAARTLGAARGAEVTVELG